MKLKKYTELTILVFLISFSTSLSSQDSLRIGDYFDYLSYQVFTDHIETPGYYYSAADVGIVQWNKSDFSYDLLSKVDGLSDIEPEHLAYDETTDAVIIAYANANLDILFPQQTVNVRDILTNQKIAGRRSINKLITEDGRLYIIGDYGLSIYDLENAEFVLTLFTESPTVDFNFTDEDYFISTTENYYRYDRDKDERFLVSLTEWNKLGEENNLDSAVNPGKIGVNDNCIIFQDGNSLLKSDLSELSFSIFQSFPSDTDFPFMKKHNSELQIGVSNQTVSDYVLKVDNNCSASDTVTSPCINQLYDYLETTSGDILIGDGFLNFHYIDEDGACNVIELPGPQGVQAYNLHFRNDTLYTTAGGVNKVGYQAQSQNRGFSIYDGKNWYTYSLLNNNQLRQKGFGDIVQAIPSGNGEKIYLNSATNGLGVFEDGEFSFYGTDNSCLENVGGGDQTVRIPAMTLDDRGDLWMSNYFTAKGLKVLRADGSCEGFNLPSSDQLGEMVIDENGILWAAIISNNGAILVYDTQTGDHRVLSTSNTVLSNDVRSLAIDKNGTVWIGAMDGAYLFYDPFNGSGTRPAVDIDQDNVGDYLLMDQFVTAVAVDAANRKWFGTNNGVIVQSASGLETELRLTTDNSPLPSNEITDFTFDDNRGIAYIGTKKGILGVKIKATEGNAVHKNNIYAYPNPVRPDYTGPIAIKGLAENANVKIVDQEGYLVKELEAFGGQAIWDGTDLQNNEVATGVYFVYSAAYSTTRKPDAATTKILYIK